MSVVSVVCGTVLYETPPDDLRRLAKSVQTAASTAGVSYNFSAIDNSTCTTQENFAEIVGKAIPAVLHPSEGNIGFGSGHNRLMSQAFAENAQYYIALNPDGFLHPDAISALVARAQRVDDFALLEARQFPNEHPKIYNFKTLETPWCSGACLMIPQRLHAEIGGFDDGFFMYCEDVDLSWRTRLAGARCLMVPEAFFFHDIVDRAQSNSARWHMALSMKRLMSKWLYGIAPRRLEKVIADMLVDVPEAERLKGSKVGTAIEKIEHSSIADFQHYFGFAPFRWA